MTEQPEERQELKTRGKYHTFFFWNLSRLQERKVTIWGADEEWCKASAWDILADRVHVKREHVKQWWRLTSILIQPALSTSEGSEVIHVA